MLLFEVNLLSRIHLLLQDFDVHHATWMAEEALNVEVLLQRIKTNLSDVQMAILFGVCYRLAEVRTLTTNRN